jgi:DNA polymerase III subunit beta
LLAQSSPEHTQLADGDSTLFFVIGKRLLTTRSLTGKFPDYEGNLRRDNNNQILVGRAELTSSIVRVCSICARMSKYVPRPAPKR